MREIINTIESGDERGMEEEELEVEVVEIRGEGEEEKKETQ